jgi:hypothetical protein
VGFVKESERLVPSCRDETRRALASARGHCQKEQYGALAQEPTLIMPVSSSRVLLERMDGFLTPCTSQLRTTVRHEQQFHS